MRLICQFLSDDKNAYAKYCSDSQCSDLMIKIGSYSGGTSAQTIYM